MKQLGTRHHLLLRILSTQCLFLTRRQIESVLGRPTSSTKREISALVAGKYLVRRYRSDTFVHLQTPLYYLGEVGWRMAGKSTKSYRQHKNNVEDRAEWNTDHLLCVYDVLLKFILEAEVKRIIGGEDRFWQDSFSFGNIPDGWIQFSGGEAFIEVDRGTERPGILKTKIENYTRLRRTGTYEMMFPGCTFKVLFITNTEKRVESLLRLIKLDEIWVTSLSEFLRETLGHQHWFALRGFYALPVAAKKEV
jgi:protein involved in plasmid replication-relaxation